MPKAANPGLSKREAEVLRWLVQGHTNREIGEKLDLTENTIEFHVKSILTKLGVPNRTAAAIRAVRDGLVDTTRDSEDYGNR